jgi:tRNA threonylcarbamoyladenosine biosynthesis protein TsaE
VGRRGKLALQGPLGAGKTTLLRAMARAMALSDPIDSPTFSLLHVYGTPPAVYHFDFYRIESEEEVFDLGYEEYFYQQEAAVWVEWPEQVAALLPPPFYWLAIEVPSPGYRDYLLYPPESYPKKTTHE